MPVLTWSIAGFLLGSIPFSLLLGRLAARADIRRYGDGNPGAVNAFRAGGWRVGVPALLLDFLKGGLPVGLAYHVFDVQGWGLVAVALAPVFGHAFSPFLHFQGGKALAVSLGVWTALTVPAGPFILGLILIVFYGLLASSAWAVTLSALTWGAYLFLSGAGLVYIVILGGNLIILLWKHRDDLRQPIKARSHVANFIGQVRHRL
jgi:glycerol-3-phosphate acyltransferase PlsY